MKPYTISVPDISSRSEWGPGHHSSGTSHQWQHVCVQWQRKQLYCVAR